MPKRPNIIIFNPDENSRNYTGDDSAIFFLSDHGDFAGDDLAALQGDLSTGIGRRSQGVDQKMHLSVAAGTDDHAAPAGKTRLNISPIFNIEDRGLSWI